MSWSQLFVTPAPARRNWWEMWKWREGGGCLGLAKTSTVMGTAMTGKIGSAGVPEGRKTSGASEDVLMGRTVRGAEDGTPRSAPGCMGSRMFRERRSGALRGGSWLWYGLTATWPVG